MRISASQQSNCAYRNSRNVGVYTGKHIGIMVTIVAFLLSDATLFGLANPRSCESHENDAAFDLGAPPKTRIRLTPNLSFGARAELEYQLEKNFDLDPKNSDDLAIWEPSLSLAFSQSLTEKSTLFLNIEFCQKIVDDEENKKDNKTKLKLKQAFFSCKQVIDGLSLKIGRQRFKDKREWVYDQELDAVRLFYGVPKFALDFSVSKKRENDVLSHGEDEQGINYVLYGSYALSSNTRICAYSLVRHDKTASNESPLFYGMHLSGEVIDNLDYWLELAHVRGRSESKRIRGLGFDLGFTYELHFPLRPSITLGYAFGSGDNDPSDEEDKNFRQTGFQDNSARFNGVTRLKYYGEMLDPELSNLAIFTAGFGIRPTKKSSIDLVYHYYRQNAACDKIRDCQIDKDPNGLNKKLGKEIDLVAGYNGKRVKAVISIGYFVPGEAFPDKADDAIFTELEISYDF